MNSETEPNEPTQATTTAPGENADRPRLDDADCSVRQQLSDREPIDTRRRTAQHGDYEAELRCGISLGPVEPSTD